MKLVIIGGGAAGMMAACAAAENGASVCLLERNSFCGMKLNITGKGRCNLTNHCTVDALMTNVVRNAKFLYSAFNAMSPVLVMEYFEKLGVPLKTERGNRVFPVSDHAKDISGALKNQMHRLGVSVIFERADEIVTQDGAVCGVRLKNGQVIPADKVILACGGQSYPRTGSDGDGYRMAKALGHTVTPLHPSLTPLETQEDSPARMEGLSLKNVSLLIMKDGKKVFCEFGEMLFTARGISGPLVLSASAHMNRKDTFPYQAFIDLKPALNAEMLDKRILRDFSDNLNRSFSNVLSGLLPAKMIPVMVDLCGVPATQKVNTITKEQREHLCKLIKAFPLTILQTGSWHEAVVTAGGVSVKEVQPRTMESKLIPGLYFAGEILDVDAYTGGFNLQIAWSTGYCAGIAASKGETAI